LNLRGNGADILWREYLEKPVHDLSPCPEVIVGLVASGLRQTSHGALEAMAVNIGEGWQQYPYCRVGENVLAADVGYAVILYGNDSVFEPSILSQCVLSRNFSYHF